MSYNATEECILCVVMFQYPVCGYVSVSCVWLCFSILCVVMFQYPVCGYVSVSCVWLCFSILCVVMFQYPVCGYVSVSCVWLCFSILCVGMFQYPVCGYVSVSCQLWTVQDQVCERLDNWLRQQSGRSTRCECRCLSYNSSNNSN